MPLTYRDRGTSGTQLTIVSGKADVGSLWKVVLAVTAGEGSRWHWTWHSGPGDGRGQHGTADSIDEAKAALEAEWRALDAAGLTKK